MKKYDLLVIGWGKGGKTLAATLAKKGWKIALVEKDPLMYGGTCINVGCLPSKSFAHSAKSLQEMRKLGLETSYEQNAFFYEQSLAYKRAFVKKLNAKNHGILANSENVDLYLGVASFTSEKVVSVALANGETQELTADKIVINTGAKSRELAFKGLDTTKGIIYSNQALQLDNLPRKMLIVGAGFIGLEFANYFNQFGSNVSVFQHNESFCPTEDDEDAKVMLDTLLKQNVDIQFNVQVLEFSNVDNQVKVVYNQNGEQKEELFDNVLLATGRVPNLDDLNLETANIKVERGAIVVDDKLETSVKDVYAIGDVKGGAMFTYVSLDDSRILLSHWLDLPNKRYLSDREWLPWSTFIDPSYARAGYNEKELKAKGIAYSVKYAPTMSIPKAHVINETEGFTKILINDNDEIVGAVLFHYEAHEMINILALAIKLKIKYTYLRDFIYTHPTFTESLNDILK
ncbi:dihydrolipoyl dehydrogenase family protein [Mycoplasma buteonis]|uniref:dihydrolipoyl dehydrogenase family protein n=1 Tax=Mycoplasma buteonis TaxID=171280 RepID=UPI00056C4F21|nr:NAD(P)/FAD-dependent oxidoreductase [Mycoplasma buteonis]